MLGYEEKEERRELLDAVADAGRLAKGLDQLLESLAHADQLDPLDVEGLLALRSISGRCAERIGTPRASWRRRTRFSTPRSGPISDPAKTKRWEPKRKSLSKPIQGFLHRSRSCRAWTSAVPAFPVPYRAAAL